MERIMGESIKAGQFFFSIGFIFFVFLLKKAQNISFSKKFSF